MAENMHTHAARDDGEDLLTTTEAASLVRISRSTLFRAVEAGKITPLRTPGGHFRFRRSDVLAMLKVGA
ncbi:helix-turn-helix DNA binding protein [Gordonia phage UmaThurman]|uniref:helix-turn-helix DNA binding protein n=1 Tax=Gordonia phage UmaThurman TaxID=1821563 RepID=UPI00078EADBF|nr:helix-turn-helix DNA binding protein [Gordonia phage UmaThurman]AMS03937.1 helix-turn-helix DNA binding protein [Gordonia phage UmaThurman]